MKEKGMMMKKIIEMIYFNLDELNTLIGELECRIDTYKSTPSLPIPDNLISLYKKIESMKTNYPNSSNYGWRIAPESEKPDLDKCLKEQDRFSALLSKIRENS